jgi:hypothetical protein
MLQRLRENTYAVTPGSFPFPHLCLRPSLSFPSRHINCFTLSCHPRSLCSQRDQEVAELRESVADRDAKLDASRADLMEAQAALAEKDEQLLAAYESLTTACRERAQLRTQLVRVSAGAAVVAGRRKAARGKRGLQWASEGGQGGGIGAGCGLIVQQRGGDVSQREGTRVWCGLAVGRGRVESGTQVPKAGPVIDMCVARGEWAGVAVQAPWVSEPRVRSGRAQQYVGPCQAARRARYCGLLVPSAKDCSFWQGPGRDVTQSISRQSISKQSIQQGKASAAKHQQAEHQQAAACGKSPLLLLSCHRACLPACRRTRSFRRPAPSWSRLPRISWTSRA